jgi:hypothetical protein
MLTDARIAKLMGWSANPAHVTGVLGGGPADLPARVRAVAQAAAEAERAPVGGPVRQCTWWQDGDEESDTWLASCGRDRYFMLNEGTPSANKMTHCCYCGGVLREVPQEPDA